LLDQQRAELVSVAAQLPELPQIRVPLEQGVAGYVARTGRVVNIPYCESDTRFWRKIDQETGYTTRSMLAGPLYDSEQGLIGVVQFLNKRGGMFTTQDEALFQGLSAQAAALLQETTLGKSRSYTDPAAPRPSAQPPSLRDGINLIVGQGPAMQAIFQQIRRVAPTEATVLLRGESGTGKGLVARALHHNSARSQGPFVHVDCTTLPEGLIENELFGHEAGAYTGAQRRQPGKVEQALGGTLFLDEIGDLPLALQSKLLTILQEHTYTRLGGTDRLKADIRILAATNRDLERLLHEGKLREDLYYRLRVVQFELPPLRERGQEDLLQLINHFVAKAARRHSRPIRRVRADALRMLLGHHWPGNVRELEHCIESAVIFADEEITPSNLSLPRRNATLEMSAQEVRRAMQHFAQPGPGSPAAPAPRAERGGYATGPYAAVRAMEDASDLPPTDPLPAPKPTPRDHENPYARELTLRDLEADYIRYLLARYDGNRSACARILGVGRNTLHRKLKEYGIEG
jgi:Nif-specific regulatory protein